MNFNTRTASMSNYLPVAYMFHAPFLSSIGIVLFHLGTGSRSIFGARASHASPGISIRETAMVVDRTSRATSVSAITGMASVSGIEPKTSPSCLVTCTGPILDLLIYVASKPPTVTDSSQNTVYQESDPESASLAVRHYPLCQCDSVHFPVQILFQSENSVKNVYGWNWQIDRQTEIIFCLFWDLRHRKKCISIE